MMLHSARRHPHASRAPRAGVHWIPLTLLLAGLGLLAWLGFRPGGWFQPPASDAVHGVAVRRGPLRISVLEKGNLKAADALSLKSEIEGQTAILWLIEEGKHVNEGDLLCELDATSLIDRRFQEELNVRNAEASFVKAKQTYEIQVSQNTSDIAKAEQKLEFAKEDLRKFLEGDKVFELSKAQESIVLATEEDARARDKLAWSEKLAEKGFLTTTELEADRLSAGRATILLEQAKRELELLKEFTHPRKEAELVANRDEAVRELERVQLQAKARIVDFEADVNTNEAKLKLEQEKLRKIVTQIDKAKIVAPRAGMVVYGQQEGGRMGNREPIAEGTQVRERQEIISIPSAGGMVAQASLHESVLKQVRVGQSCVVKVDSIPGREFPGRVKFVAPLPDQQSFWANPNLRVYRTDIEISEAAEGMRPGMSCSVEILVDEIPDALYVPVQSVFRTQGKNICFRVAAGDLDAVDVEIGRFNDKWVQVVSGLTENEVVSLVPPTGFTPEGSDSAEGGEATPSEGADAASGMSGAAAMGAAPGGNPGAERMGLRGGANGAFGRPEGGTESGAGGSPGAEGAGARGDGSRRFGRGEGGFPPGEFSGSGEGRRGGGFPGGGRRNRDAAVGDGTPRPEGSAPAGDGKQAAKDGAGNG